GLLRWAAALNGSSRSRETPWQTVTRVGPSQVFVQEFERPPSVDRVRADEELDPATIADPQAGIVQVENLGEFVGDRLVGCDAVEVAPLDHEWPRGDQGRHLGVIERATQVELEDLVFAAPDVTIWAPGRGVLPDPFVEIGRANRQAVILHERRD